MMKWLKNDTGTYADPEILKSIASYKIEEMKILRSEIVSSIDALHKWENFALLSIGAIYTYFISSVSEDCISTSKYMSASVAPLVISIIGCARSNQISNTIRLKDKYLMHIESSIIKNKRYIENDTPDWDKYIKDLEEKRFKALFLPNTIIRNISDIIFKNSEKYACNTKNSEITMDNNNIECINNSHYGWVSYFYQNAQMSYIHRDLFWSLAVGIHVMLFLIALFVYFWRDKFGYIWFCY